MKSKRTTAVRMLALFLTAVLMITSIDAESVSAFWNQDGKLTLPCTLKIDRI